MSTSITGKVEKAYKNDNGYGSILIGGNWYGTGKEVRTDLEGASVSFEAVSKDFKGKTFYNVQGPIATTAAAAPAAAPAASGGARTSRDEVQILIMRQNAHSTAASIVSAALAAEAIPLPKAKNAQLDAILGFVDSTADHVFGRITEGTAFEAADDDPSLPPDSDFKATEA